MNTPITQNRDAIKISDQTTLHLGSEGEWPYIIEDSYYLNHVDLTTREFNALAAHAPVVQTMKSALRDAMDWIKETPYPAWQERCYQKRSRVIEGGHAAIQGMEDAGE